ncbi:MAG: Hsp20/alpha crystallin family protein [bacterium]
MTLVRLEPSRGFERLGKRFSEFANEFEKGISFEMGGFSPRIDITEDDKNLFVHAEIAGMGKSDVKVSINEERLLTLKGEKKKAERKEDVNFLRNERVFGEFERSFMLPDNVDVEKIHAKYDNGILELVIPKMEPPKPKEINVEIN